MLIIPSIDILDGKCVRLLRGEYNHSTVYHESPVETARNFEEAGAGRIHIVDLDAARGSEASNREVIRKIRAVVSCLLEIGGGIRGEEDVAELLDLGVDRLVLGTILVRNPDLAAHWRAKYGPRFIAGIDALDGQVKISGWQDYSGLTDVALAKRVAELGIAEIIYTSIARDGGLAGPDLARTNLICESAGLSVILSGGIASAADIERVFRKRNPLLTGVITGKAVYEGRICLPELFRKYGS